MKINVYGTRGFPDIQGGVEKHCEELYPSIASHNNVVKVFRRSNYVSNTSKMYNNINFCDIKTVKNKFLETLLHSFKAAIRTINDKPDIAHIHNIGPASTIPLLKLFGIKTVVTYHSPNYEHKKWNRFAKAFLLLSEKIVLKFADKIIFVSEYQAKKLNVPKNRYVVIPNGISQFTTTNNNTLKKFSLEKNNYVLTVGRIVEEKSFDTLISAVSNKKISVPIVIVGGFDNNSKYYNKLKTLANKSKTKIIFTGSLKQNQLMQLYAGASLFCLPSENEAMPIVLLEAMSFGLPILASNIPQNSAIIKDYGITFKVKDTEDLKKQLMYLLDHHIEAKAKGKKAQAHVRQHYRWEIIAKQTKQVYEEVLKK